jgi:hypothetical protein
METDMDTTDTDTEVDTETNTYKVTDTGVFLKKIIGLCKKCEKWAFWGLEIFVVEKGYIGYLRNREFYADFICKWQNAPFP